MYIGIDFIINPELKPYLIEVNLGLPGGAQEYELSHQVYLGITSDIFSRIENISLRNYGKKFKDYLDGLPFITALKPFKIWMDGKAKMPDIFHPALRLEDKWIQYQLIKPMITMPETIPVNHKNLQPIEAFLKRMGRVVLKRRLGRGGRGFKIISDIESILRLNIKTDQYILQEYIESKVDHYVFSIRSIAFGGEFICMYANLSKRDHSNHGIITFVSGEDRFGLEDPDFETKSFCQKSWEAQLWFGENDPPYLRHNLYEDEVAKTTLFLPQKILDEIKEASIKIERYYDGLDFHKLPQACFELQRIGSVENSSKCRGL